MTRKDRNKRPRSKRKRHLIDNEERQPGPTREAVVEARQEAHSALIGDWETPAVRDVRTLQRAENAPHVLDTAEGRAVLLISVSVEAGRPRHGAKMSADHVGSLEAEVPRECPDCSHDRARLTLSRHHNIAGGHAVVCPRCDHEHEAETWG